MQITPISGRGRKKAKQSQERLSSSVCPARGGGGPGGGAQQSQASLLLSGHSCQAEPDEAALCPRRAGAIQPLCSKEATNCSRRAQVRVLSARPSRLAARGRGSLSSSCRREKSVRPWLGVPAPIVSGLHFLEGGVWRGGLLPPPPPMGG